MFRIFCGVEVQEAGFKFALDSDRLCALTTRALTSLILLFVCVCRASGLKI